MFAQIVILILLFLIHGFHSPVRAEQALPDPASHDSDNSEVPDKSPITNILENTKVNLSYYFDSRDYNSANVLVHSTALPWGFNIFGFSDFHGNENAPNERFELKRYYHEYRLRRPLDDVPFLNITGLGLELEINDSSLPNDEVARLGLGYQHSLPFLYKEKSWLQWRILPYRSDGRGWQLSMTHVLVLSERFKLTGFADYNIMNDRPNEWVAESELSFRLTDMFDLILEGRYNGFEGAVPGLEGVGVAGGIRIKL